jgi:hypothetical protein
MGIEVLSTIGNHTTQDIKDIKPLKKLNVRPLYIALITFALASFFVCVVRTLKTIKNQTKEQPQIELDPKIKASNDLENLYKNKNAAGIKPFYYGMSEILRIYVSKKYNFDAMEMTTAEFFGKMKTFLPQNININEFKNYLKTFNLARYADFKPTDIEIENNYAFTKKLLESL